MSISSSSRLQNQHKSRCPNEIDTLLREDDVRKLHDITYSAVFSYTKLLRVRENYRTDEEFIEAPGVALDVRSTLDRLEATTALLRQKKAFGPTTAMVIPSAFFLEHSLLLLRRDRPRDIATRLEASLEWLDQVADPLVSTSTATYRAQAVLRHQQYMSAALENPLGKKFVNFRGEALFECVGVHDYVPEHWGTGMCFEAGRTSYDGPLSEGWSSPIPIQLREAGRFPCQVLYPEHSGPSQSRFQNIVLEEMPYNAPIVLGGKETEKPAGFLALYLNKRPMSEILPTNSKALPPNCPVHNVDASTPETRANWLENFIKNSSKQTEYEQLKTLVDLMNLERARISLATAALTIVAKGRTELQALIQDLKG